MAVLAVPTGKQRRAIALSVVRPHRLAAHAALAVVRAVATAQPARDLTAPLPPTMPWHGPSERLVAPPNDPWITPAEAGNFDRTPTYAETRAWLDRLVAASPSDQHRGFGQRPRAANSLRCGRETGAARPSPCCWPRRGIHSGEIDGKDAGLMLLRDIGRARQGPSCSTRELCVRANLQRRWARARLAVQSPQSARPEVEQGWRTTAQKPQPQPRLPEGRHARDAGDDRALLAQMAARPVPRPARHRRRSITSTTSPMLTAGTARWPTRRPSAAGSTPTLPPALMRDCSATGHIPGPLVFAVDGAIREGHQARRRPAALLDRLRRRARASPRCWSRTIAQAVQQRVLGTYVLIEHSLYLVGLLGDRLQAAIAADRASEPRYYTVSWKPAKPLTVVPEFKGIAHDTFRSAASGRAEVRWLGRAGNSADAGVDRAARQSRRL